MFLREKESERSPQLLQPSRSLLLVIDMQERFASAIADFPHAVERASTLVRAAARLQVPVLVTEQYPKALGKTVDSVRSVLPAGTPVVEKLVFSAFDAEDAADRLRDSRRNQIILCGVEAHVCVLQTAFDLLENLGAQVCVVKDAVASRSKGDRDAAFDRLAQNGAHLVTTEMVLFEWLRKAGTPEFKELQALVK